MKYPTKSHPNPNRFDAIGKRFGRATIVADVRVNKWGHRIILANCDCGNKFECVLKDLKRGNTTSCGCRQREAPFENKTHGHTSIKRTSEFRAWEAAKQRCTNPKNKSYSNYGGRGIKMCDSWLDSFECFIADMGLKPTSKHQIDRINNDGNYEPGNCRWVTPKEQANNTRRSIGLVEFNGISKTLKDWAKSTGISYPALINRIKSGWPLEKAMTIPVAKRKRESEIL